MKTKRVISFSSSVDDRIKKIESQIYSLETKYLQEDCPTWNIVKGFDGFMERFSLNFVLLVIGHREQVVVPRFLVKIGFSHFRPTVLLLQAPLQMMESVFLCSCIENSPPHFVVGTHVVFELFHWIESMESISKSLHKSHILLFHVVTLFDPLSSIACLFPSRPIKGILFKSDAG